MRKPTATTDISDLPEVLRLAEEVQASGEPRVLTHGDQEVAVLAPVVAPPKASSAAPEAAPVRPEALPELDEDLSAIRALFGNFVGLGNSAGSPDDPDDVSENKHKYLADAYDVNPRSKQ